MSHALAAPHAEELPARYRRIREDTLRLAAPLAIEDQVVQVSAETSPTKWHLAHTTWFFERFCLATYARGYEPVDPRYDTLFNSYYYTVGEMHARAERGLLSRPTVADIREYRARVDAAMTRLLAERSHEREIAAIVELGLNHEQQHQELLLTDVKQVLFANPLGPRYADLPLPMPCHATAVDFVTQPSGVLEIGADGRSFCFDNETPRHRVLVREHALGSRLVANAEYREFIDDGGYGEPRLWLADGWAKIRTERWSRPLCWSEDCEREFTLGGWREIDAQAPVCHVSYYEADAFARWAGRRLPTEAEWEIAAAATAVAGNTLETGFMQPVGIEPRAPPVGSAAATQSAMPGGRPPVSKISQLWGDVWEWCASSYGPYPGFEAHAGSLGEYNGKFMCNQVVVRGGSCASWAEHLRPTYRSFFYPQDRWQFLGFRLANDL